MAIKFLNTLTVDTDVLYVDASSNNVGIGTTSPQDLLHLSADSPVLRLTNTVDTGKSSIEFWDNQSGTSQAGEVFYDDNSNLFGLQGNGNGIVFRANNTFPGSTLMRLNGSGNLGIGTTTPGQRLMVASPSATSVVLGASYLSTNNNNFFEAGINANDGYLNLRNSGVVTTVHIDSDGNSYFNGGYVGIGTTSPGQKLTIDQGVGNVNQGIPATSGSTQNGILRLQPGGPYGESFDFGMNVSTTYAWIQPTNKGNHSVNYNLSLNPNGGNVGIGTTSPEGKLHVKINDSGATPISQQHLILENNSATGLGILTPSSTSGYIFFGDENDAQRGYISYSHLTDYMTFKVNGTERVRITNTGNVGIGTTSPTSKLHVAQDQNNTFSTAIAWTASANDVLNITNDNSTDTNNYASLYMRADGSSGSFSSRIVARNTTAGTGELHFQLRDSAHTANTETKLMIDSGGNVGIGTTGPGAKLHVSSGTANEDCVVIIESDTDNNDETSNPRLELRQDAGAVIGRLGFRDNTNSLELINQYAESLYLGTSNSTDLTILSNGNVGIGTTSPVGRLSIGSGLSTDNSTMFNVDGQYNDVGFNGGTSGLLNQGVWSFINSATWDQTRFYVQDQNNSDSRLTFDFKGNAGNTNILAGTSSGKVGIGTTSPLGKLDVKQAATNGNNSPFANPHVKLTATSTADNQGFVGITTATSTADNYGYSFGAQRTSGGVGNFKINYHNNSSQGVNRFLIDQNGNVGIGTTSPAHKLDVAGNVKISSGGLAIENTPSHGYVALPGGAFYHSTSGTETGAIKITLPTHGTADMLSFVVDIFDYTTNESFTVNIKGYLYQTTGNNEWVNVSAQTIASNINRNFTIRFGADGSNHCVWIGETNSSWSYPQIQVRDFTAGYTADIDSYIDGWDVDIVTSFDTVDLTYFSPFPMSKEVYGSGIHLRGSGSSYFNGGNVGIGETNPAQKLHVIGNSEITGDIFLGRYIFHNDDTNTWFGFPLADTISFRTNGSDRMYINSSGNVGIGTTSPSSKLQVNGDLTVGDDSTVGSFINVIAAGTSQDAGIRFGSESNTDSKAAIYTNTSNSDLHFDVTETTRMLIDSATGNVGIGTTSPASKIHTYHATQNVTATFESGDADSWINIKDSGSLTYGVLLGATGNDFIIAPNNSEKMRVTSAGNVGIGTTSPASQLGSTKVLDISSTGNGEIILDHTDAGVSSDIGLYSWNRNNDHLAHIKASCDGATDSAFISFHTQATGGSFTNAASNERMRITSTGNVGIGTTSPSSLFHLQKTLSGGQVMAYFDGAAGSGAYGAVNIRVDNIDYGTGMRFHRSGTYDSGAVGFINGTSTVGSININTSSTSYNTTSDYRLKENLTEITDGIDRIKQLKPKRFNFIGDTEIVDGFVAHEAKQVVPEAVTGEKDEVLPNGDPVYQGIDQSKIVPLLTAALQEAITKIEILENRLQTLENK